MSEQRPEEHIAPDLVAESGQEAFHEVNGLIVADEQTFWAKVDGYWAPLAPGQVHEARFDQDETLVVTESSWQLAHLGLPEDRREVSEARRRLNRLLERLDRLNDDQHLQWSVDEFNEHIGTNSLEHPDVVEAIRASRVQDNAARMFGVLHWAGVVTLVVTAGIKPVAEQVLEFNGIKPRHIVGNDPREHETAINMNEIVHPGTKSEFADKHVPANGAGRRILVVGNTLGDARMALDDGRSVILRGRVCKPGGNDQAYLNESFYGDSRGAAFTTEGPHFDFVIAEEDFMPLIENVLLPHEVGPRPFNP